MDRGTSYRQA